MPLNRPAIPIETQRLVLFESRHHCAVCCNPLPLEQAHVIAWAISHDHSVENLIAMCANCHARADHEDWGVPAILKYKQNPCILARISNAPAMSNAAIMQQVDMLVAMQCGPLQHRIAELESALAAYANAPGLVRVISVTPTNSSKVTVILPPEPAKVLIKGLESKDPTLQAFLGDIELLQPPATIPKAEIETAQNVKPSILSGPFYTGYKEANPSFSADTFRCAEETVTSLLTTVTTSDNPGMLLGKVQSGKTRTFISILALAFDNGLDIAIVLSKNSRALIEQTAKRLNSEFKMFIDDGELEIYDIMHAPETFGAFELESKLIFVAKKQDDNLRRLIELFEKNPAMAAKRTIFIDDEADTASIGYTKKAGLIEAKTIAGQISQLRSTIKESCFLQVTATPYSLYLQPTEVEVVNIVDFKPTRPKFTKLVPVPADYVGGNTYFGESSRSETDTLESLIHHTVDHNEFDRLKKQDNRSFKLDDVLTAAAIEGYRTAILNFIVGGCIQRINGGTAGSKAKKLRYSFLLHSEAGRPAHNWQETLTKTIVSKLAAAAQTNDPIFNALVMSSYKDLSRSLALDSHPVPAFENVRAGAAEAVSTDHITIVKVNSDDDVAALLDTTGQLKLRSPLNIFLGGQVLDRGVTLANLIGFYYGRRPNKFQQDTVLQHSRMYGYRRADLAVTRFYTSKAIRFAMSQMEEFDASLRNAIELGGNQVVQFIRKAADGSVVPCNPNKILISTTQTLRPYKRILPIGFQTGYRTGANAIGHIIQSIDTKIDKLCGFNADEPVLVPLDTALDLLRQIQPTLHFEEDDAPQFDWEGAKAALTHLSKQHPNPAERGKVLLWAAKDRQSARQASVGSHATYIETPDSEKVEGQLAKSYAIVNPILFLLRQDGDEKKGWRGTAFYWPVIRAQLVTPTVVYTGEIIS